MRRYAKEISSDLMQEHVEDIIVVSESEIVNAMYLIWERMKIVCKACQMLRTTRVKNHGDRERGNANSFPSRQF